MRRRLIQTKPIWSRKAMDASYSTTLSSKERRAFLRLVMSKKEYEVIAKWRIAGLDTTINRPGWYILSSARHCTVTDRDALKKYFTRATHRRPNQEIGLILLDRRQI